MRLIVTGATGMAGAEVVRQALAHPEIAAVTALVRRRLDQAHPRLTTLLHDDFLRYDDVLPRLAGHDACLWCLGVSQRDVAEPEYVAITRDYTLAGATALQAVNPGLVFGFLSGEGADTRERSRLLFGRVKGQTENRLAALGLARLYVFRPAYIEPVRPRTRRKWDERLLAPFTPLLHRVFPQSLITSVDLARAMIDVVLHGADRTTLGNMDLRRIAGSVAHS